MSVLPRVWMRVYLAGAAVLLLFNLWALRHTGWQWWPVFLCLMTQMCFFIVWQNVGLMLKGTSSFPRPMKIANSLSALVFAAGLASFAYKLIMIAQRG